MPRKPSTPKSSTPSAARRPAAKATTKPTGTRARAAKKPAEALLPPPREALLPAPAEARPATGAEPKPAAPTSAPRMMSAEERYRAIAHQAYLRAERRGFAPGHEMEDWLAAEADVDAMRARA